ELEPPLERDAERAGELVTDLGGEVEQAGAGGSRLDLEIVAELEAGGAVPAVGGAEAEPEPERLRATPVQPGRPLALPLLRLERVLVVGRLGGPAAAGDRAGEAPLGDRRGAVADDHQVR